VDSSTPPPLEITGAVAPLIAADSRSHHFGPVISKADRKLTHAYHLDNKTKRDVRIVELVNRKPCCGEIGVGQKVLRPGDRTDVVVRLSVRQEFGEIVHDTVVVTSPPQPEPLVLRTMATAYPPIRIEEVASSSDSVLLTSDQPTQFEFRVLACGTAADPPVDLDRVEVRSTIKASWVGSKVEVPSEEGLTTGSRLFAAWFDSSGTPGERRAELQLAHGANVVHKHVLSWEAVSPIKATPKMIVMKPGERECRVLFRSRDQRLFRITGIECKVPGVQGRADSNAAAQTHTLDIESHGDVRPQNAMRLVTVFTDHPAQQKVEIPYVVID